MKKTLLFIISGFLAIIFFINACPPAAKLVCKTPKGWPQPNYVFENNKLTQAGFELGRKLFYDPRISRNNTVSCGSCHQPFAAFSHIDHSVSHGIDNKLGTRNAPPLFNLNWQTNFMWDGGVNHIEIQPLSPMTNSVEMGQSLDSLLAKLNNDKSYKASFKKVFGTDDITSQMVFKALAQFMGMLMSSNSKYDKYIRHEQGGEMTASELHGLAICSEKCGSCHKEPLFSDFSYKNNGLTPKYGINDSGRAHITHNAADLYKFKVPSLRNLKYTMPYMHDGRFNELNEVLDHYTNGNKYPSATIDPAVKFIYLTEAEKGDLLAFLNTLNDEEFVKDNRFRDVDNKLDRSNEHHTSVKR